MAGADSAAFPAEVTQLNCGQRERGVRTGGVDERVDRVAGQWAGQHPVADPGNRLFGVHVQVAERGHRDSGDGVVDRAECAQRAEQRVGLGRVAGVVGLHDHERLAADLLGDLRDGREVEEAADRGELVRDLAAGQVGPGVQHLGSAPDRVPQGAGVGLGDREEPEFERGDDAEAAAAAAQRPEQVRLVPGVGAHQGAVGGHHLGRGPRCWPPGRTCGPGS